MGKPIVMGRKTWESFPKRPLPGRLNIVVTPRSGLPCRRRGGCRLAAGRTDAGARQRAGAWLGADEICIIGGGEIYRQAIRVADRLHLTHVLAEVDGDTVFPTVDPEIWEMVSSEDTPAGEKDSHATRYTVYARRPGVHEGG